MKGGVNNQKVERASVDVGKDRKRHLITLGGLLDFGAWGSVGGGQSTRQGSRHAERGGLPRFLSSTHSYT